ncbi:Autophagy-related protein like [Actinidia chinensis var. chinensis]|uniref:Autophagy-related protein like n=1 Tax=Actinidia chinensis var. chinensis TaxID=1590841 RepID=A0A2R6S1R7_ACTCC|nr:Autophagy-related protein like [Actinidia chinensis var. chinensis]
MVLSSNGMYIATASEQFTIVRVHLVSEATKLYSFRRGTYPSTIFSFSFGSSMQLPDILIATSSSGSVHAFSIGFNMNQSYAVIHKIDKVADSSIPESMACRWPSRLLHYAEFMGHVIHHHLYQVVPGVQLKHQPSERVLVILGCEFNLFM